MNNKKKFKFSNNAHLTRKFHFWLIPNVILTIHSLWWKNVFFFSFFGWKLWVYKRWTFDIWQTFELHIYAIIIDLSTILISSHVYNICKNYIYQTFVYVFIFYIFHYSHTKFKRERTYFKIFILKFNFSLIEVNKCCYNLIFLLC